MKKTKLESKLQNLVVRHRATCERVRMLEERANSIIRINEDLLARIKDLEACH